MMKNWFTINEFSQKTGFSNKALRLYEQKGILSPHTRTENLYRIYSAEQIELANRIQSFKTLGFSLEQIRILIHETNQISLKEIITNKIQDLKSANLQIAQQLVQLESILTSLNQGIVLTKMEREHVMENIFESSINKLKCRGTYNKEIQDELTKEVHSFSPEIKKLISELNKLKHYAEEKNIFLGPGRGTSPASLVLFSQDSAPFNPLRFGLIPELFSQTKYFHIDVEFSRSQDIGKICDTIKEQTNIEVVAFKNPFLDILAELRNQIGEIHYDRFSDSDLTLLQAPRILGTRGLFGVEWSNNFHAWQSMPEESKNSKIWGTIENWFKENDIESADDFINLQTLHDRLPNEYLDNYKTLINQTSFPELDKTKGLLIYREDWIKIVNRLTNLDFLTIRQGLNKITQTNPDLSVLESIKEDNIKQFLVNAANKLFAKSHAVTYWWYYKRSAILKLNWPHQYLAAIDKWEQKNQLYWQEFGYPTGNGEYYLKA